MILVSAVMPTRGRCDYAAQAVECFHKQSYPNRELVILDDFDTPSFPNGITHPLIRYYQTENIVFNIPVKRNRVNALAKGEILLHIDSDDFSAPTRMAEQVQRLQDSRKAVTGYHDLLFIDEARNGLYEYRSGPHYACGSSLCYRKWFWELHKFPESKPVGSDNHFVRAARDAGQLDSIPGGSLLVARIHDGNTSRKANRGANYHPVPHDRLPVEFRIGVPA